MLSGLANPCQCSVLFPRKGELTCCRKEHKGMERCDRQSLVVPILGLYGELFRAAHMGIKSKGADMSTVEAFLQEIHERQDEVFPREFKRVMWRKKKKVVEDVVLFGDLIDRMRMRVKNGTSMLSTDSEGTESIISEDFVRHGSNFVRHGHGSKARHGRNLELSRKGSEEFARHGRRRSTTEMIKAETGVLGLDSSYNAFERYCQGSSQSPATAAKDGTSTTPP